MAYASGIRGIEIGLAERALGFFRGLSDSRRRYRVYRQTVRELAALSERDLADLGLHRSSISTIAMEAAYGK